MKLKLLILTVIFSSFTLLQAQRKSDLVAEIATLKTQLDSLNSEITEARKNEKVAQTESNDFKAQVTELQDANKTLMQSLTSFTEVSSKNQSNFNLAMERLTEKEQQLKAIQDALASNDSTALIVLTNAKQTLGENAKMGVSNGVVIISEKLTVLFGEDTSTTISVSAEPWVQKIGQILTANPNMAVTIEGLSMTGDLDLPAQQALAISSALQRLSITSDRITAYGKDGNLKEGIQIKIHPNFEAFYAMVKAEMKQNK